MPESHVRRSGVVCVFPKNHCISLATWFNANFMHISQPITHSTDHNAIPPKFCFYQNYPFSPLITNRFANTFTARKIRKPSCGS
jgi:hypothetical protein